MALPILSSFPQSGSIVSRWKLDEASGTRIDDVGANDLTDNNTVTSATGQFSADAADFEAGNSEFLSITDASQAGLETFTAATFSAWVKIESAPATDAIYDILSKYLSAGNHRQYRLMYQDVSGIPELNLSTSSDGASVIQTNFAQTLTPGTWYHIIATFKGSTTTVVVYVNGASIGTNTSMSTEITNKNAEFRIGNNDNENSYFDGLIQDVMIWNVALTGVEAAALYNAYFPSVATGNFFQVF